MKLISELCLGGRNRADLAHPEDCPKTTHAFRTTSEARVVALHPEHGHLSARLEIGRERGGERRVKGHSCLRCERDIGLERLGAAERIAYTTCCTLWTNAWSVNFNLPKVTRNDRSEC